MAALGLGASQTAVSMASSSVRPENSRGTPDSRRRGAQIKIGGAGPRQATRPAAKATSSAEAGVGAAKAAINPASAKRLGGRSDPPPTVAVGRLFNQHAVSSGVAACSPAWRRRRSRVTAQPSQ